MKKKTYCITCNENRKFTNPKIYIFHKILVPSIIWDVKSGING